MSVGFNFKVAPVVTNPSDVTPEFVVFGASSQSAESPVLIRVNAFDGSTNLSVTGQSATSLTISSDTGTDAVIPAATTSLAGLMTAADKIALAAAGTGSTNLSITGRDASTLAVASDTGTDATIPAATTSLAGLMTAADKTTLDALDSGTAIADAATVTPGAGDFFPFLNNDNTPAKVEATFFASAASLTSGLAGKQDTISLSASRLYGRGASGGVGEITLGTNLSFSGTTLNATGGGETSQLPPRSGGWLASGSGISSAGIFDISGRIFYVPIIINTACTIDRIGIHVQTAAAGTNAKLGIYAAGTNRLPGAKIADCAAAISTASSGRLEGTFTVNPSLAAGLYWLAWQSDSAGFTLQPRVITESALIWVQNSIGTLNYVGEDDISCTENGTYASGLPANATASPIITTGSGLRPPAMSVRVA